MPSSRGRIVGLVAGLTIVCSIGCGGEDEGGAFPTAVVERRPLEISAQAAGMIEPVSVVVVKSKAAGEITDLPVESGDVVASGDLLVQVEREEAENAAWSAPGVTHVENRLTVRSYATAAF